MPFSNIYPTRDCGSREEPPHHGNRRNCVLATESTQIGIPSFILSMSVFIGGIAIVELHCERLMDLTSRPNLRRDINFDIKLSPVRCKTSASYVENLPHKSRACKQCVQYARPHQMGLASCKLRILLKEIECFEGAAYWDSDVPALPIPHTLQKSRIASNFDATSSSTPTTHSRCPVVLESVLDSSPCRPGFRGFPLTSLSQNKTKMAIISPNVLSPGLLL